MLRAVEYRLVAGLCAGSLGWAAVSMPGAPAAAAAAGVGQPLTHAHAHNDYAHPRPLLDALGYGFTSVEADVFLHRGELLVGHGKNELDPARTLRALYLDPLAGMAAAGGGRLYRDGTPITLLIDVKSAAGPAYRALEAQLRRYPDLFTSVEEGRLRPGAVTAIVSGNRDLTAMATRPTRRTFYDGRSGDLLSPLPATLMPLLSERWSAVFTWNGSGPVPARERDRLDTIVAAAHAAGRRVRFWATPDGPGPARDAVWRFLLAAEVDLVNTDDLDGLSRFLRAPGRHPQASR